MSSKSFIADLDRHGTVAYFCHQPMVLAALHEATNTIYPAIYGWELELSHVILRWLDSPNAVNYSSHLRSDNLGVSGEGRANLVAVFLFFIFRLLVMGGKRSCVFSGFSSEGRLPIENEEWVSCHSFYNPVFRFSFLMGLTDIISGRTLGTARIFEQLSTWIEKIPVSVGTLLCLSCYLFLHDPLTCSEKL